MVTMGCTCIMDVSWNGEEWICGKQWQKNPHIWKHEHFIRRTLKDFPEVGDCGVIFIAKNFSKGIVVEHRGGHTVIHPVSTTGRLMSARQKKA